MHDDDDDDETHSTHTQLMIIMETGWSPWEGHPYYIMAIIGLLSDIQHLIIT